MTGSFHALSGSWVADYACEVQDVVGEALGQRNIYPAGPIYFPRWPGRGYPSDALNQPWRAPPARTPATDEEENADAEDDADAEDAADAKDDADAEDAADAKDDMDARNAEDVEDAMNARNAEDIEDALDARNAEDVENAMDAKNAD